MVGEGTERPGQGQLLLGWHLLQGAAERGLPMSCHGVEQLLAVGSLQLSVRERNCCESAKKFCSTPICSCSGEKQDAGYEQGNHFPHLERDVDVVAGGAGGVQASEYAAGASSEPGPDGEHLDDQDRHA